MRKLYAVVLGGKLSKSRLGEDHETVFVVSGSLSSAKDKAIAKWSGVNKGKVHVDAISIIDIVDGYKIELEKMT